jgi:translation initiation factor IF-3
VDYHLSGFPRKTNCAIYTNQAWEHAQTNISHFVNLKEQVRINHQIRASELRIIGPEGENFGVLSLPDALAKAQSLGLDLIEVSATAVPPIAKIMDYGKFRYEEKRKSKASKTTAHATETKTLQVKIGTGEHDLELKAKRASEWLHDGDRIKIDLFLPGRAKYLERHFLEERLERLLRLITESFKVADPPKKSPKGLSVVIERSKR